MIDPFSVLELKLWRRRGPFDRSRAGAVEPVSQSGLDGGVRAVEEAAFAHPASRIEPGTRKCRERRVQRGADLQAALVAYLLLRGVAAPADLAAPIRDSTSDDLGRLGCDPQLRGSAGPLAQAALGLAPAHAALLWVLDAALTAHPGQLRPAALRHVDDHVLVAHRDLWRGLDSRGHRGEPVRRKGGRLCPEAGFADLAGHRGLTALERTGIGAAGYPAVDGEMAAVAGDEGRMRGHGAE